MFYSNTLTEFFTNILTIAYSQLIMHNKICRKYNKTEVFRFVKISELNPFIRYARARLITFRTGNKTNVCYDCRLFYFDNVTGSVLVNGKEYTVYNKSVLYLPPESQYRFNILCKENAKVIILDFDLTQQNSHLPFSLGTATEATFCKNAVPPYKLPQEMNYPILRELPQAEYLLMQCVEYFLCEGMYYRESASAMLKLCLLELLHRNAMGSQTELCRAVLRYIHAHFDDASLTNLQIAAEFGYHPEYLSALIKAGTGKTLHQYLIGYRLQMAKDYLITTQYDISEIAWRCGFCTAAYFIKKFRENTGFTPKNYRKQQIYTEL